MENGKLTKLQLIAYSDNEFKDATGEVFTTLINPEKIVFNKKISYKEDIPPGSNEGPLIFDKVEIPELDLEFLFDGTGVIQNLETAGNSTKTVQNQLDDFENILIKYEGDTHQIKYIKVLWGDILFKGVVTEISVEHKLFSNNGSPLRSTAKVKFKSSTNEILAAIKANKKSPDLTHLRMVVEGDTLPALSNKVYGDSKYYLEVAKANKLTNFRKLIPGQQLSFPPIEKLNA